MSGKELTGLIMQPGFSTAAAVTHTSGRGVGMDVVKKNIEKLNGTIEIDSKPGIETRFRIKIPLTLAIIPALLVQVRGELFTIPLSTVEETIRISPEDLSTIEGVEVMQLRESTLPLVRLADLFNMPTDPASDGRAFVVVVSTGMKRVGLVVDVLLGQEEVVIKPLEDYLQEKSGFSGATILGDGRISLILDIYELVNLSIDRQAQRKQVGTPV
jgi:two-component system chemotaxis sensor kinase CheA